MSLFNVTITEQGSLQNDVNSEVKKIKSQIPKALNVVGSDMIIALQRHLKRDWYDAYTPTAYQRRTDNPALGTPLGADENITTAVMGTDLAFDYAPTGEHRDIPIDEARHGNALIEWIQARHGEIPERPFWNNFVYEMEKGGIVNSFIKGMQPFNVIKTADDDNINLENSYLAGNIQFDLADSSMVDVTDTDELPF